VEVERLVVIKLRGLGDTLLSTPALRALRRAFPRAHLTAVVSPAGQSVLAANPDVDEIWVYDKAQAGGWRALRFMRRLARGRFSLAIALHASFRTALLALASGAAVRVVHNHSGPNYFSTVKLPVPKVSQSAMARDLDAIRALGLATAGEQLTFPVSAEAQAGIRPFLRSLRLAPRSQPMLLVPGAGKTRKCWAAAPAAAFLDAAARRGVRWIILSGPDDAGLAREIQSLAASHPPVFTGTLSEVGALMTQCRGVVTTDSGPKHVAVAVGVPTLTLWTDESEAEWHPYDQNRHALVYSPSGVVADIPVRAVVSAATTHFRQAWKRSR